MAKGFADLSGDIDALYQGPLGEFTAGRNALEKRVKAEQGKEAAAAIKALEKPSVSAWAVNQLFWRYRTEFDRLLRSGDDLRASQQKRMAGRDVDVNAAIDARREALSKLMGRAVTILEEGGTASDDIRQRVGQTLEALSVYGTSDAAPRPGRMTGDVQPPGFAALAALVPAGPPGRPTAAGKAKSAPAREEADEGEADGGEAEERDESGDGQAAAGRHKKGKAAEPPRPMESKRAEKARLALEQAEAELARARESEEEAAAEQATAQKEWEAAKAALDEIQQKLDEAMDREKAAHSHRDEQRRAATQAAHAASRAERARNEAERYLQSLVRG
jgi:hypothetical protein